MKYITLLLVMLLIASPVYAQFGGLGIGGGGNALLIRGAPIATTAPTTGQVLTFNEVSGQWEPNTTTGATTFLALTDTPDSYATFGGSFVKVNAGATALEFVASSVAGHSILGGTHTDSTTGTVVRGDIITGQG